MNSQVPESSIHIESESDKPESKDKISIGSTKEGRHGFWEILPSITTFLGTVVLSGVSLWMSHSVQQIELQRQERESQREAQFKQAQVEQQKAQVRVEELKALTALAPLITSRDEAQRQMGLNILYAIKTSATSTRSNLPPQEQSTRPRATSIRHSGRTPINGQGRQQPRSHSFSTLEAYAEIALSNETPMELRESAAKQITTVYKSPSASAAERAIARRQLTRIQDSPSPAQVRAIAAEGLGLITRLEGTQRKAFRDSNGAMVIGSGHALTEKELATGRIVISGLEVDYTAGLTDKQARDLLSQDLEPIRRAVDELVEVPINNNQRDALVSFAFNEGVDALRNSDLLKLLNQGNYTAVPAELMKWTKREGVEFTGLRIRRMQEIELWNKPPQAGSQRHHLN